MRPPWRSTIFLQTASPIPWPSYCSASWARWKASKIWSRSEAGMPMPSSATVTSTRSPSSRPVTRTRGICARDDVLHRVGDQVVEQLADEGGVGVRVGHLVDSMRGAGPVVTEVRCSATERPTADRSTTPERSCCSREIEESSRSSISRCMPWAADWIRSSFGRTSSASSDVARLQVVDQQLGPAVDDAERTAQVVGDDTGERLERRALGPVGGDVVVDHHRLVHPACVARGEAAGADGQRAARRAVVEDEDDVTVDDVLTGDRPGPRVVLVAHHPSVGRHDRELGVPEVVQAVRLGADHLGTGRVAPQHLSGLVDHRQAVVHRVDDRREHLRLALRDGLGPRQVRGQREPLAAAERQQDAEAEHQADEELGDQDLLAPGADGSEGSAVLDGEDDDGRAHGQAVQGDHRTR